MKGVRQGVSGIGKPHGAFNGGERDRIHFIFEVFEGAGTPGAHWDVEESVPV